MVGTENHRARRAETSNALLHCTGKRRGIRAMGVRTLISPRTHPANPPQHLALRRHQPHSFLPLLHLHPLPPRLHLDHPPAPPLLPPPPLHNLPHPGLATPHPWRRPRQHSSRFLRPHTVQQHHARPTPRPQHALLEDLLLPRRTRLPTAAGDPGFRRGSKNGLGGRQHQGAF